MIIIYMTTNKYENCNTNLSASFDKLLLDDDNVKTQKFKNSLQDILKPFIFGYFNTEKCYRQSFFDDGEYINLIQQTKKGSNRYIPLIEMGRKDGMSYNGQSRVYFAWNYKSEAKSGFDAKIIKEFKTEIDMKKTVNTFKYINKFYREKNDIIKYYNSYDKYILLEWKENSINLDRFIELKESYPINKIELLKVFFKIVDAIGFLHSIGVAHRDIKASNFLIDVKNYTPTVIDFGYAVINEDLKNNNTFKVYDIKATPLYAAPEIWSKKGYNPFKVDIYALGLLLYSIWYGKNLYQINNVYVDNDKNIIVNGDDMYENLLTSNTDKFLIDDFIKDIVLGCCNIDPRKRISIKIIKKHLLLSINNILNSNIQKH